MAPTKKSTTATASAAAAAATNVVVPEPTPVSPPAAEVVVDDAGSSSSDTATSDDIAGRITNALEKAQNLITLGKELTTFLKSLQKEVAKLQKGQGKKARRAAAAAAAKDGVERKPSGFAKPTLVSKELCEFLGVPADKMLARTEVTRLLNKYIKDNKLQDPVDRRTIRPDDKLQKLLNITGETQLKYFNMQSYIKHHFIKSTAGGEVASA